MQNIRPISALLVIALASVAFERCLAAEGLQAIEIPGDRAFMESITAGPDGTLYVSSLASGGIARIKPGASKAEEWIAPRIWKPFNIWRFCRCKVQHPMGLLE